MSIGPKPQGKERTTGSRERVILNRAAAPVAQNSTGSSRAEVLKFLNSSVRGGPVVDSKNLFSTWPVARIIHPQRKNYDTVSTEG
jgi:hypothetical protein